MKQAPESPVTPSAARDLTLKSAASFLRRHPQEKSVSTTYGYFVTHPVAPLNRKRLGMMLARIEEISRQKARSLRVLDLACGGGLITCAIGALGHRVLGLDLSPEEIHLARLFSQEEKLS